MRRFALLLCVFLTVQGYASDRRWKATTMLRPIVPASDGSLGYDSFTSAETVELSLHTADTGNTWTRPAGGTIYINDYLNQAAPEISSGHKAYLFDSTGLTGDQHVQAYVKTCKSCTPTQRPVCLGVRISADGETWYAARHSGSSWEIYERSGAAYSLLTATTTSTCMNTGTYLMDFSIVGTHMELKCNNALVFQVDDATIESGSPGLVNFYSYYTCPADDFKAFPTP